MHSSTTYFNPSKASPPLGGNVKSKLLPYYQAITNSQQLISTTSTKGSACWARAVKGWSTAVNGRVAISSNFVWP